ncbi:hypothetical protein ABW45_04775 [Stenotrophomonas maltophilia]|nr:hypothetical protein ABW45_04775 [Stenotrophomonas maltophilia]
MAKKWVEVASSPAYQALAPEQQEEARNQYWNEVVAPNVPAEEHSQVRQAFDSDTSRTVNWPDQAPLDVNVTGGIPAPADFSGVTSSISSTADGRQADGWMPGAGRDFAFGVRSALQGAGGLLGAVGGDAFNNYVANPVARAVGLQESRPYREEAAALADRLGLPKAQTGADRVLGDVGEALAGTGLTMGAGAGINALASLGRNAAIRTPGYVAPVKNKLAEFLTAQPGLQTASAITGSGASSIARESGASQKNQLLAGLAGGLAPGVATAGGAAALRGAVRGRSGEGMQNTLADFQALGATPSVGQAAGPGWVQGLEGLLSKGPTSGGVFGRFAENQADRIGAGLNAKASNLSPNPGSENAGLAIERGMDAFKGDTTAVKRALYWAVDQQIPGSSPTPMANTQRMLQRLTTPNPSAKATTGDLIQPSMIRLRDNLEADLQANGGNLPYEALKRIRTDIGEQIGRSSPLNPSTDLQELNKVYSALSEDMLAAAKSNGPAAVKAAARANNYTRNVAERNDLVQRVLDKKGGPEKVYQAAMSGTKDGATTLRAVMYSLPKEEQKAVSAAVIKRMGLATPGNQNVEGDVFSSSTFMRNWNDLSEEAKAVLFGRYGKDFKESMNQVAKVANNIKQGAKVYANPSGSGDKVAAIAYWVGLLNALGSGHFRTATGVALGGASANVASRILTSPIAVRWLAQQTNMPKGALIPQAILLQKQAAAAGDTDLEEIAKALEAQVRSDQPNASNQQR